MSQPIHIRLSAAEVARLDRLAASCGQSRSRLAAALLGAMMHRADKATDTERFLWRLITILDMSDQK